MRLPAIVDPKAAASSAIGVDGDVRRFGKINFGMVRQHENTERRVETITDIGMEPIPVAFVIGESDTVLHPEAPAVAVVGGIAIVGTAAGKSFRHAGFAYQAIVRKACS